MHCQLPQEHCSISQNCHYRAAHAASVAIMPVYFCQGSLEDWLSVQRSPLTSGEPNEDCFKLPSDRIEQGRTRKFI